MRPKLNILKWFYVKKKNLVWNAYFREWSSVIRHKATDKATGVRFEEHDKLSRSMYRAKTVMRNAERMLHVVIRWIMRSVHNGLLCFPSDHPQRTYKLFCIHFRSFKNVSNLLHWHALMISFVPPLYILLFTVLLPFLTACVTSIVLSCKPTDGEGNTTQRGADKRVIKHVHKASLFSGCDVITPTETAQIRRETLQTGGMRENIGFRLVYRTGWLGASALTHGVESLRNWHSRSWELALLQTQLTFINLTTKWTTSKQNTPMMILDNYRKHLDPHCIERRTWYLHEVSF